MGSACSALTGFGDQFASVEDVVLNSRPGLRPDVAELPMVDMGPEVMLNRYAVDFFETRTRSALETENMLSNEVVFNTIEGFGLYLRRISLRSAESSTARRRESWPRTLPKKRWLPTSCASSAWACSLRSTPTSPSASSTGSSATCSRTTSGSLTTPRRSESAASRTSPRASTGSLAHPFIVFDWVPALPRAKFGLVAKKK